MSKIYPNVFPRIKDWPINVFADRRKDFINDLNEKVYNDLAAKYEGRLEELLNKTIYLEKKRTKTSKWKVDPSDDKTLWPSLGKEISEALKRSDQEEVLQSILKRIINRYNEEITGGFKVKTFYFARKFLTFIYKRIYNPFTKKGQGIFWGNKKDLLSKIKIDGCIEETRSLFHKGTVVIVPTHFSNLDSIMAGYALNQVAGLPAFVYGAGLNLFDVEIAAFFMNRLGAYRVDRRKKNPIYLACLTTMASLSLQKGVNNIFFPGGTRSRSGAMEEKLKLGLLGSVIDAQREIIFNNEDNKIFIVPITLGYHFVFEAKSLIEQHLKATGVEKYSRSKENAPGRFTFKLFKKFFSAESEFYMSFGEPMDVLGNLVDKEGNSIDKHNRPVDMKDYFKLDGDLNENAQRESVYARHLGSKVLESYFKNNLILPSHLVAYVGFKCFEFENPKEDVFSLLRKTSKDFSIDEKVFEETFNNLLSTLHILEKEEKIRLHPTLFDNYNAIVEEGMKYLGAYHSQTVLFLNKGLVKTENLRLLYFYANRLEGYSFEKLMEPIKTNA